MAKHHHTPSPRTDETVHWSGAGSWLMGTAFLLPLAAIVIMLWLGADVLIVQDREHQRTALEARTELLAAQVHFELRCALDQLSALAMSGRDDPTRRPGLGRLQDISFYPADSPPADPMRITAFRHARSTGWDITVIIDTDKPRFLLVAADVPGQPATIAMAELSPTELLRPLHVLLPGDVPVLLDRSLIPVSLENDAARHWRASLETMVDKTSIRSTRPVHLFALHAGIVRPAPDALAILTRHGQSLLVGGVLCAVLVCGLSMLLMFRLRSRLAESEQKRKFAMQEIEHVQKLSSIGRLAAGVAHEINNPLAIIAEKAGLMKDLASAASDMPKAQRFIALSDSVLQSVSRCRMVTHRLLGFARRMEVRTTELQINDVLREVVGFLEREATYRGITLEQNLAENMAPIESDRGQLQQVFLNLLNNAMTAVADHGHIRIGTTSEELGVQVEIADNGVGMSRETLMHIFEPFFSTKGEKGTGLGLSITYGIVTKLGGIIEVESEEGKGTRFVVHLPLHAPEMSHGTPQATHY